MRHDVNAYYAFGLPLYLALISLEIVLTRRRGLSVYRFAETIGSFSAGLGEIVLGLFLGPYLLALYDFGYRHLALWHWQEGSIVGWVLAFLLGDFGYYWNHRAGHRFGALWAIHGVHHQTERLNISVATRHPWLSDFYAWPFYVTLPICGVTATQFFVAISIISFYALTVHSHAFYRPSFGIFVTPQLHQLHHAKNRRYLGKNLGAMFIIWDRMFGTYVEPCDEEPPVIGTPAGYQTHDGARSQWTFWRDLFAVVRHMRSLRPLVERPGWRPADMPAASRQPARDDAATSSVERAHAALQFTAVLGFAMYLLWLRSHHGAWLQAISAAAILFGLFAIGGLLDAARGAASYEAVRLALFGALGTWLVVSPHAPGAATIGACLAVVSLIGAATLVLISRRPWSAVCHSSN